MRTYRTLPPDGIYDEKIWVDRTGKRVGISRSTCQGGQVALCSLCSMLFKRIMKTILCCFGLCVAQESLTALSGNEALGTTAQRLPFTLCGQGVGVLWYFKERMVVVLGERCGPDQADLYPQERSYRQVNLESRTKVL